MSTNLAMIEPAALPSVSGLQKVVILLLAMDETDANDVLSQFSPDEIKKLGVTAQAMPEVTPQQLRDVVQQFSDEFEDAADFARTPSDVFAMLDSSLFGGDDRGSGDEAGDDDGEPGDLLELVPEPMEQMNGWEAASEADPELIQVMVEKEHSQAGAFLLSKIDQTVAFKVLDLLDAEKRFDVLSRMLAMRKVHSLAASAVERSVARFLGAQDSDDTAGENRKLVAGIVNRMDPDKRDSVLGQLGETMPEEAALLKTLLFSFEDVPTLDSAARAAVFDTTSSEVLVLALRGCESSLVEVVLESLGQRARRMVEAELKSGNEPPVEEIKAARQEIASTVLALASEGKLKLPEAE